MMQEREVRVGENIHTVTISDEQQTLLAAKAAGRVVVGYLHDGGEQELSAAEYLIETLEGAEEPYLERVVRRHYGIPWVIAESERLIIREFTMGDIPQVIPETGDLEPDTVFYTPDKLEAYIRNQYRYYELGLWAVIRKEDGVLLGKAGVSCCDGESMGNGSLSGAAMHLELGYHIFKPYRGRRYAVEACRTILDFVKCERDCPVYAVTDPANECSIRLLRKLGFEFICQKYIAATQLQRLYGWNC